jgi:hypothetical protein
LGADEYLESTYSFMLKYSKKNSVFSYVCIYLAFETVKNLVEHILQVWFWVLPRGDGIAKEDEVIDDALGINTDHLAHAPEG